jgi:large subunit ribosomal protein L23
MILKRPIITEKSAKLAEQNQYVFEVAKEATKSQIKKEVEERFGVEVLKVRIINLPSKKRTFGRVSGFKKGLKKAIVKIKEGQKIDIFPSYEKEK